MPPCLKLVCSESEYSARNITLVSAVPNEQRCKDAKDAAEAQAKALLEEEVKEHGEKVDTCKDDPACRCKEMPPWPPNDGGWERVDQGLRKLYRDITTSSGCEWKITLEYDRYYRSRSADCIRKPPKTE